MQSAERGLRRLELALDQSGTESLTAILHSLGIRSFDEVRDLAMLRNIVVGLEKKF